MCNRKSKSLGSFLGVLVLCLPQLYSRADNYVPFETNEYDPKKYKVSKAEFHNGDSVIRIIEAKNTSGKYVERPYLCRAWFEVSRAKQTTFQRYFDDIDAVGFSYGLFIPKLPPPPPYFAVIKNGDYDGRLYLVHESGEVFDLIGGFYFLSNDKRFLFSQYASDTSGLAVFDFKKSQIVFSSDHMPAYQHQWYTYNETYFFTASEWLNNSGMPSEKTHIGYFYDTDSHKIVERIITKAEIEASNPIKYDFDPRDYNNCDYT